jgi:hypothetical protein
MKFNYLLKSLSIDLKFVRGYAQEDRVTIATAKNLYEVHFKDKIYCVTRINNTETSVFGYKNLKGVINLIQQECSKNLPVG